MQNCANLFVEYTTFPNQQIKSQGTSGNVFYLGFTAKFFFFGLDDRGVPQGPNIRQLEIGTSLACSLCSERPQARSSRSPSFFPVAMARQSGMTNPPWRIGILCRLILASATGYPRP